MRVLIQRTQDGLDMPLPVYASEGAAGLDLHAALPSDLRLEPGQRALVSTGIRITLPVGYEGQIRPRSGFALRHGLTMVNSPGTVDSDYRGTLGVILINLGQEPVLVQRGDRIAQLVVAPITHVEWQVSPDEGLPPTERGLEGFGSTGFALEGAGEHG